MSNSVKIYGDEVAQHRLNELLEEVKRLETLSQQLRKLSSGDKRDHLEAEVYTSVFTLRMRSAALLERMDALVEETDSKVVTA